MMCALRLADAGICDVAILERNDRLGKKLSATGNGQGNITNSDMDAGHYCTSAPKTVAEILNAFGKQDLLSYLTELGGCFAEGDEGKIYPSSFQAASVTDIFRFALQKRKVEVKTGERVLQIGRRENGFIVTTDKGKYASAYLVLASGGAAAKHFGTDGSGYELAKSMGHSVTQLFPALVRLKTERDKIKGLKGVRSAVEARLENNKDKSFRGDVIFTDFGIGGNIAYKLSSYAKSGDSVLLDFLPFTDREGLCSLLANKARNYPEMPAEDFLRCVVHSAVAKAILNACGIPVSTKCSHLQKKIEEIVRQIKGYRLRIEGNTGFDDAQVTKGGIRMEEVDENLMSRIVRGLYFAGEILDVDGECGGYNLQWAFSSGARCAAAIAEAIANENR